MFTLAPLPALLAFFFVKNTFKILQWLCSRRPAAVLLEVPVAPGTPLGACQTSTA